MKQRYRITWLRQLPEMNIVGHAIMELNSYDALCYYFNGTLVKVPKKHPFTVKL